jgi:NAD(P)-dependent dehydrogenase (short-subunit alcohol dehydrogenase family)
MRSIEAWVSKAHRDLNEIYALVNNAGVITGANMCELTEKEWENVYDVNAKGVWMCMKAVVPEMKKRKKGKIVNISSIAGKTARPNFMHYNSSKSAVLGITMSAAIELAPYQINVNAVCPGTVDNPYFWEQLDRDLRERVGLKEGESLRDRNLPLIPMGRFVRPEDVAAAVSFFVSHDSDAITGESLNVTCGRDLYV